MYACSCHGLFCDAQKCRSKKGDKYADNNAAGDDFYNFTDFIPAAHSKVPLAIINTSLDCYLEVEDRALKVLDKLIELRWSGVDEYLRAAERL